MLVELPDVKNEADAKVECIALSKDTPTMYVYIVSDFSAFAVMNERLHINAPSDCHYNWYVLNGVVKTFSGAKVIADQNATPTLS